MADKKSSNKENNRDRFVRIIERRVNIVLNNMDSLSKCSNKKNYEYTDADVKKIFGEIDKKCREVKAMFSGYKNTKMFKL